MRLAHTARRRGYRYAIRRFACAISLRSIRTDSLLCYDAKVHPLGEM